MLKYAALAIILLLGAAMAYVRLAPIDTARHHVDPETADRPSVRGQYLVRPEGDQEPPIFEISREDLALKVDSLILASPRTTKIAGDLTAGFASYATRSGLWAFPDIASVKVVDLGGGKSSVLILSRQIYGIEDLGVNKARVEDWLGKL